nr:unnamed protein product [Callosobruchus chinensis]
MNVDGFNRLLKLIEPHILKLDLGREPMSPQTRLPITLRYLASGDSMMSLSYLFRVGKSTVSNIISETLDVIWNVLQPLVLVAPNRE